MSTRYIKTPTKESYLRTLKAMDGMGYPNHDGITPEEFVERYTRDGGYTTVSFNGRTTGGSVLFGGNITTLDEIANEKKDVVIDIPNSEYKAVIRSSGVQVGCTFVSAEIVDAIHAAMHNEDK